MSDQTNNLTGRVKLLWHSAYWDGPLSGYVALDGELGFWVECVDDWCNERPDEADESCADCPDDPGGGKCCELLWDRLYLVYRLDKDQHRVVTSNHELFRRHVGTHTDYDGHPEEDHNPPDSSAPITLGLGVRPRDEWDKFYKAERPTMPPLRPDQVVGSTLSLFL